MLFTWNMVHLTLLDPICIFMHKSLYEKSHAKHFSVLCYDNLIQTLTGSDSAFFKHALHKCAPHTACTAQALEAT